MTQLDPMPTEDTTSPQDEITRQATSVSRTMAGNALAFIALGVYLAIQTKGAWQAYAIALLASTALIGALIAANLFRRGQPRRGGWLLFTTTWFAPAFAAWVLADFSYVSIGFILVSTYFVINFAMPRESRRAAWINIAVVLLIPIAARIIDPAWRLASSFMLTASPIVTSVLGAVLIVIIVRQVWSRVNESLPLKITVWTGSILAVASIILVSYSAITFFQTSTEAAEQDALGHAETEAGFVRAEAEIPLDTARALAQALTAVKNPDANISLSRDEVNAMLRQITIENPTFLGTYTLWEPNAFDGLDAQYVGAEAHDETGRFIPYWVRRTDGSVSPEALIAYETPVDGDWYLQPRSTRIEYTIAPLIYPVGGVDTVMATYTVPIVVNNTFYGITGVDAPITFVQELVDSIDLYDGTADAVLMSASGTLIGVTNHPELVNQPATEIYSDFPDLQERLEAGEAFISPSPDGQFLRVFAPVDIGQTGTHWTFSLLIPNKKITEEATTSALTQAGIGLILIIVALFLLRYLTGQIVLPLVKLTDVANAVAAGNLESRAEVTSSDEVGTLASTFNAMTSQLQGTLQGMEQRVAERTQNLELAAEVGRSVSQVRDLDIMLRDACQLILREFDLYYVQVYLTDPRQRNLILEAGTGDVGMALLGRGHSLPFDATSLNGRAAVEKHSVVIADTALSPTFRSNPLLPNTRGEMAVPLIVADNVVGVLDMQTINPGTLNEEVLPAFEALAGQLAVAIQNAKLVAEANDARAEVETQARRLVRRGWSEHMDAIHKPEEIGFVFAQNQISPLAEEDQSLLPEEEKFVSASISVTGESLGSLVVEIGDDSQNEQTSELVTIVARQVAQQIENLRLLESAERYRSEAEQSARRQTQEGWQEYIETRAETSMAYLYDANKVQAHNGDQDDSTALMIPLKAHDETVGKLSVQGITTKDVESLGLANAVAERLGEHLENLRLSEQTKQALAQTEEQTERLGHLNDFSEALSQSETLDDIYKTSAKMLPGIIDAARFSMTHPVEGGEMLEVFALQGESGVIPTGTKLPIEGTAIGTCYTERRGVIDPDLSENTYKESALLAKQGLKSTLSVPLIVAGKATGTVNFANTKVRAYSNRDQDLAVQAASLMASAIENRQQYQRAQKQADRETLLNTINQKIQGATSVEAVLQIAARELGHALDAPMTIAQLSIKDQK